jgi:predicted nucleic acid-binding protein
MNVIDSSLLVDNAEEYEIERITSFLKQGRIIDLTSELALAAAFISKKHQLPMADSIIYATARHYGCNLWTQDDHFVGLDAVHYFIKEETETL